MHGRAAFVCSTWTVNAIGHIPSKCWWHVTSSSGGPDIHWESRFLIHQLHWTPLLTLVVFSWLDRGIQSTIEMLPLKRGRVLHPRVRRIYILLTHLFLFCVLVMCALYHTVFRKNVTTSSAIKVELELSVYNNFWHTCSQEYILSLYWKHVTNVSTGKKQKENKSSMNTKRNTMENKQCSKKYYVNSYRYLNTKLLQLRS